MTLLARRRMRLSGGTELAYVTAGDPSNPALLPRCTAFPARRIISARSCPKLSRVAYVIAPDLPGYGESDVLPEPSFPAFGQAISELLSELAVGPRYIYVHDFGAPPALHIAMQAPDKVLGLIIQNANAHQTGFGPEWAPVKEYWSHPNPENEAASTAHLTFEGRAQRLYPRDAAGSRGADPGRRNLGGGLARDAAAGPDGNAAGAGQGLWQLRRPVRRNRRLSRALAAAALMLWARHDPFFALAEVMSWMEALPRMEAHILDGGHKLLETHAEPALALMLEFIARTQERLTQPASEAQTRTPALA